MFYRIITVDVLKFFQLFFSKILKIPVEKLDLLEMLVGVNEQVRNTV